MDLLNPYVAVIALSLLIIISYLFNLLSSKSGIPSVLLLIVLGILINLGSEWIGLPEGDYLFDILEILGIIGLIMIVLEAALDLELNRDKWPVIWKSLVIAFSCLIGSSVLIAFVIQAFYDSGYIQALIYAIPLSVISSAIIIPSVGELMPDKREFMIYESTFSDIMGIMYFYFLVDNLNTEDVGVIVGDIAINIVLTIAISVVASYLLVLVFQRLKTQVKLFLLTAVLLLLYSFAKLFHLSSLLIILVFGLILNNYKLFFQGKLKNLLDGAAVYSILNNFHLLTIETAFVIRTLFFVLFGITIEVQLLGDTNALLLSILIVAILFLVRAFFLKVIVKRDLKPQLFMAPRGLITILLFFSIPAAQQIDGFNAAVLLYTILITCSGMALALMGAGKHIAPVDAVQHEFWEEMDKEIEKIPEEDRHQEPERSKQEKGS